MQTNEKEILFLKDRYQINTDDLIGQGKNGNVYGCIDILNPNPNKKLCARITNIIQGDNSNREFQIISQVMRIAKGNPNIVEVMDVLVHEYQIVLIQERCECDLSQLINKRRSQNNRFTPQESLEIIRQISNGYKVLIAHNIIHRDLKPENILYQNNIYKIADFGFARIVDPNGIHTKLGTPRYSAPEIFYAYEYTYKADMFSLGIIFYQLIFDSFPFTAKELEKQLFNLKANPVKVSRDLLEFQSDDSIPTLIEQMLLYEEKDRIDWSTLFKHKLINLSQNIQNTVSSIYHGEIGIFFFKIEQKVQKYMNMTQIAIDHLLHLRKALCDLAYIFLESAKNQNTHLIQQFNVLKQNQEYLQIEFQTYNQLYPKKQLELKNFIIYIQEINKYMKKAQLKYQQGRIYYFSYLRLLYSLYTLSLLDQEDEIQLYDLVIQIQEHYKDKDFLINYLNQNYK